MLNNTHWTVYCINKVHKQIEILDPQNWEQKDDKNWCHIVISIQIRGRLNNVFQMFAGSLFPDISNWISLIYPCQHRTLGMIADSSACFILRTTMVEIGKWTFKLIRLVDTSSQPFSSFVNSQPFIVHFLIMHLFYCVLSRIKHMSTGRSFCTTSCSTSWTRLRTHSLTSSSNLLLDPPDYEDRVDKCWIFFYDMCKYAAKHIYLL
jgi:hypothetical protein